MDQRVTYNILRITLQGQFCRRSSYQYGSVVVVGVRGCAVKKSHTQKRIPKSYCKRKGSVQKKNWNYRGRLQVAELKRPPRGKKKKAQRRQKRDHIKSNKNADLTESGKSQQTPSGTSATTSLG